MDEKQSSKLGEYIQFLNDVKDNGGYYQYLYGFDNSSIDNCVVGSSQTLRFDYFCTGNYRIKPKTKMVPLKPTDIKPGTVLRWPSFYEDVYTAVLCITKTHVSYYWPFTMDQVDTKYIDLFINNAQYSTDFGETWQDCSKEANDD